MDLLPDVWGLTALKCWNYFGKTLTLNAPNRNKVGSRPTEKIRRRMVEAISARMPWGWGKMMTMARETSIAIHRRADKWGSRVPEGRERREKYPLLFFSFRNVTIPLLLCEFLWFLVVKIQMKISHITFSQRHRKPTLPSEASFFCLCMYRITWQVLVT